jgi:PAS domain S-box-containing protein
MTAPPLSPLPRDASDPERLLQALHEAQELLTLAEQSAGIGIWDRDIATSMMRGTPTFFRIMGLEPISEPVHMDVVRAVRHPDDARRVVEGFEAVVAKGLDTYESEYRIIRPSDGKVRWIFGRGRTIRDKEGKPVRYSGVDIDITERKEAEERLRVLMHEVNHRANNLLAVVQAMAHNMLGVTDPSEFVARLTQRIAALAASNKLLVSGHWQGVAIEALVLSQLRPFVNTDERVTLSGPALTLNPAAAQAIGMALHELATNAVKYGALSARGGAIHIAWTLIGAGDRQMFEMSWRERGGPKVTAPTRTGFGHTIIAHLTEQSLGGKVGLDFGNEGLCWKLACPAERVLEDQTGP